MNHDTLIQPQNTETEAHILGIILMFPDAINEASEILTGAGCFYLEKHAEIYSAMLSLKSRSEQIDVITVVNDLKRKEKLDAIGGRGYLSSLIQPVISDLNLKQYCLEVFDHYVRRQLIQIGNDAIKSAYDISNNTPEELANIVTGKQ